MENKTEIVKFEQATALTGKKAIDFFTDEEKVMMLVEQVNKEVVSFVPNVKTKQGRDEIGSVAMKVSKSRKALETAIDNSVSDLQEKVKAAKAVKKLASEALNETRAKILKPRDDWQAEQDRIEKERIDAIRQRIENLRLIGQTAQTESSKEVLAEQIEALEAVDVSDGFEEFTQDALKAVQESISALNDRIQNIVLAEREEEQRKALAAERKKNQITERLHNLMQIPVSMFGKTSSEIQSKIESLEKFEVSEDEFEDRKQEAITSKEQVVSNLKLMLNQAKQLEALQPKVEPAPTQEPESTANDVKVDNTKPYISTVENGIETECKSEMVDPHIETSTDTNEDIYSQSSIHEKFNRLMYALTKHAARSSFTDFLEEWDLTHEDYQQVKEYITEGLGEFKAYL